MEAPTIICSTFQQYEAQSAVFPTEIVEESKHLITQRIRALGYLAKRYDCDSASVVGTVLSIWCETTFPAIPKPPLPFVQTIISEPEIITFVDDLRRLDFLEATYWLSSTYAMLADKIYRKKMAMFFTPPSLTRGLLDDLVEQGVDFETQSFLDPACGGAAFLAPIALRMRDALLAKGMEPYKILKHIEAYLYGTDLEKTLCLLSKHFLCMALHNEIRKAGYVPNFQINQTNSLTCLVSKFGTIDVVVCNPPYRKMTALEVDPLREAYADVIDAQPNVYGLFIMLCIRLLRINGYAAFVTPTSFLSGQYFSRLRRFLLRHTDVAHIGMVSDRIGVFIDVEQETALTVLRRRIEENQPQKKANVSVVFSDGQYLNVGECPLPNAGAAWPIPRSSEDVALLKVATLSNFRLSDYGYRVRIGAYVWNRDKRPKFNSIQTVQRANVQTTVPLLWSRDISAAGTLRLENLATVNGKPRFIDVSDKMHSSVVKTPSVVMQRVTSNDQSRRLVAAEVPQSVFSNYGGFIGENHVVIIEQITNIPAWPPNMLVNLLSTHAIDRYFRCISGATNVSAFELNQLALPDPHTLSENLTKGIAMDEAVNRSFGLSLYAD